LLAVSAHEVIDLTESPLGYPTALQGVDPTSDAAARPVKRRKIGCDVERPPARNTDHPQNLPKVVSDVSTKDKVLHDAIGVFQAGGEIQDHPMHWKKHTPEN